MVYEGSDLKMADLEKAAQWKLEFLKHTHIVAIVLCRFKEGELGQPIPNNYVVTAYQKVMG